MWQKIREIILFSDIKKWNFQEWKIIYTSMNEHFPNSFIDSGIHLLKNNTHLLLLKLKTRSKKINSPFLYKLLKNFKLSLVTYYLVWYIIVKSYYIILLDSNWSTQLKAGGRGGSPTLFQSIEDFLDTDFMKWIATFQTQILPFFTKWVLECTQRHLVIVLLPIVEQTQLCNPTPISYFNILKTIYYCLLLK